MSERREKVISEIKEVAKRIEVTLSDYRTRYYKEIPVKSRENICKWLEKAFVETETLVFYNQKAEILFYSEVIEAKNKYNTTNICNYLKNVVDEVLKFYNEAFIDLVGDVINSLSEKLIKNGYDLNIEFMELISKLKFTSCITLYKEEYPELVELQEIILIITNIDSMPPGCLKPKIHELYGVKTLLLELEESIKIVESIENTACTNIVLEYIDSLIEWDCFKLIK